MADAGFRALWGWNPLFSDRIDDGRAKVDELKGALGSTAVIGKIAGDETADGLRKVDEAAGSATAEVKSFQEQLRELRDQNLAVIDTEIAFERSLDDTAAAAKRASGGVETNSEVGRKNREVLNGLVRDTKAHAQAVLERTDEDQAACGDRAGPRRRSSALRGDGEKYCRRAEELAAEMFGIPNIEREVKVDTSQAEHDLKTVRGLIAAIRSKRVVITTQHNEVVVRSEGRNVPIGTGIGGQRWRTGQPVRRTGWVSGARAGVGEDAYVRRRPGRRPWPVPRRPSAGPGRGKRGRAVWGRNLTLAEQFGQQMEQALTRVLARMPWVRLWTADLYTRAG
ncbi:hypothetical protein OOK41_31475 [Micromonospora sp. NBC_01655]|uniref:hypothetical protein n=1 Tax=Micromonospora sp. NBC_01655 TaxID=2975983 RepID=UPI00225BABED|nr:hypothetical protein [Micromonospora sp. NBC_01655]MCX4474782.1 hypothetical protein [Micromonospora sp. NBC_01655]